MFYEYGPRTTENNGEAFMEELFVGYMLSYHHSTCGNNLIVCGMDPCPDWLYCQLVVKWEVCVLVEFH